MQASYEKSNNELEAFKKALKELEQKIEVQQGAVATNKARQAEWLSKVKAAEGGAAATVPVFPVGDTLLEPFWPQAGRRPAGAEDADGIGAQVGDGIWGTSAVSLTKPALGASSADAPDTSTLPAHPFPNASLSDNLFHLGRAHAEEPPKHVLVCAPSNAAIDEIVSRLLQHSG